MVIFNSYVANYQRVDSPKWIQMVDSPCHRDAEIWGPCHWSVQDSLQQHRILAPGSPHRNPSPPQTPRTPGLPVHPYAQVLAMFAFDSYSQSKRSPRPLSRHRPCKTPFPIGNASFNKPWPNYHGSIMFYSFLIESHRNAGFQRAFFRGHCWRPQTKTRSRPFS